MRKRRIVLIASGLLWLAMLGALAYREESSGRQENRKYLDSLFDKHAPVLMSKSVWVRDMLGAEHQLGFFETEIARLGGNDVHVRHSLRMTAKRIPPMARGLIEQFVAQLAGAEFKLMDFEGQVDLYLNRRSGLRSISGKAKYGKDSFDFRGRPVHGGQLRLSTWINGEEKVNSVKYDPDQPFGAGGSPFRSMKDLKVGAHWEVSFFEPFTRQTMRRRLSVDERKTIKYKGRPVECFVVTAHQITEHGGADGQTYGPPVATAYLDCKSGEVLREEIQIMMFKLSMVLEESITADQLDFRKEMPAPEELRREPAADGDGGQAPDRLQNDEPDEAAGRDGRDQGE